MPHGGQKKLNSPWCKYEVGSGYEPLARDAAQVKTAHYPSGDALEAGALVTIDEAKSRIRLLPFS